MERAATRFLAFLTSNEIAYAVVGAGRQDPDAVERDLELVVRSDQIVEVGRLARKFCDEHAGRLIDAIRTRNGGWCFPLVWRRDSGPVSLFRLNVHPGIMYGHRPLIGAPEVLAGRRLRDTCYAAPARLEVVHTLLRVVDRQELTSESEARLIEAWNENPGESRAEVARRWSPDTANRVGRAVASRDFAGVRRELHQLRPSLRALEVGQYLKGAVSELALQINPQTRSQGFSVAFLGIDGSGKGSVIEGLKARLAPVFSGTRYFHFKPNLLGPGPKPMTGPMVYPAEPRPGLSPRSAARLIYYLFDFWFGYAWKVWRRRERSSLIIFDRYFYDLGIDPLRLERRFPMALARSLKGFVPRPDLVILLDTPAEVARARKPEGPTIEETVRQRTAFLKLACGMPNARVLDGTKAIAELVQEAERLILDRLSAGAVRRLGV